MRLIHCFVVFSLSLLSAVVGAAAEAPPIQQAAPTISAAEEQEWAKIRVIKDKYEEAAKTLEVDSLAPYISEKFTGVMMTGDEVTGFDGLKEYNRKMNELLGSGATHELKTTYQPGVMLGEYALAYGTTDEVVVSSLKNRFAFRSEWTAILSKENGSWKIYRLHQSIDPVRNEFVDTFTARKLRWYGGGAAIIGLLIGILLGKFCLRCKKKTSDLFPLRVGE